jgi:hypothetical protein
MGKVGRCSSLECATFLKCVICYFAYFIGLSTIFWFVTPWSSVEIHHFCWTTWRFIQEDSIFHSYHFAWSLIIYAIVSLNIYHIIYISCDKCIYKHIYIYCHVLMVVTMDGVRLTTGFIGLHSYTQLQCTHYSRPSHKATLHILNGNGSSDCVPLHCLGWVSLGPRISCRPDPSSLTGSHWPWTNSFELYTELTTFKSKSKSHYDRRPVGQ